MYHITQIFNEWHWTGSVQSGGGDAGPAKAITTFALPRLQPWLFSLPFLFVLHLKCCKNVKPFSIVELQTSSDSLHNHYFNNILTLNWSFGVNNRGWKRTVCWMCVYVDVPTQLWCACTKASMYIFVCCVCMCVCACVTGKAKLGFRAPST